MSKDSKQEIGDALAEVLVKILNITGAKVFLDRNQIAIIEELVRRWREVSKNG